MAESDNPLFKKANDGDHDDLLLELQEQKGKKGEGFKVDELGQEGRTPLQRAVFSGSVECIQLLHSHNADLNHVDKNNRSCLFYAIQGASQSGDVDAIKYLFKEGGVSQEDVKRCTIKNKQSIPHILLDTSESVYEPVIKLVDEQGWKKDLILAFETLEDDNQKNREGHWQEVEIRDEAV